MNSLYEKHSSNAVYNNDPISFLTDDNQYSEVNGAKKNLDTIISDYTEVLPVRTDGNINDRRYKCLKCAKLFKRHEHLKRHIITHTGEKLFKCTYHMCNKKFSRSDEVKRHYKTHLNSYINHDGAAFAKKKVVKKSNKLESSNKAMLEKKVMENLKDNKASLPPIYQTPISSSNNFLNSLMNNNDISMSDFYNKSQTMNYNTADLQNSQSMMLPQLMSASSMTGLNMFQMNALTPGTLSASPLPNMHPMPTNAPLFSDKTSNQNSNTNTNGNTTPILGMQNNKSNAWITNLRPVSSMMSFTNHMNNQSALNLNALNLMPMNASKSTLLNMSGTSLMTLNKANDKTPMTSYQGLKNSSSATNLLTLPLSQGPNNQNNANGGLSKMGSLNQLNLLGSFNSSMNLLAHNNIKHDDDDDDGFELVIKGRSVPIIHADDTNNTENKSSASSPGPGKKLPPLKDIFN